MVDSAGTEGAGRVADVLLAFLDGPHTLGVSALARQLDLSKAVVHRILQSLVQRDLLVADAARRGYRLGPAAAALGARALRESDLRAAAHPVLRELQLATGETTTLSTLVPGGRVYIDQVASAREIKMTVEIGRRFPLHAGSSSVSILAFLPEEEVQQVLHGPLERLTALTIADPTHLRRRILEVRSRGYACSGGERQDGAGSVAAPLFGLDGQVEGAISVCGPAARVDAAVRDRLAPLVTAAAERVSRTRGWRGGLPSTEGQVIA